MNTFLPEFGINEIKTKTENTTFKEILAKLFENNIALANASKNA